MPTPFEYVGGQVDAEYRVTMAWDFKANLSDLPSEGIEVEQKQFGSVPLRGDWCFTIDNEDGDLSMCAVHGTLPYAALGERVTVTCTFAYFANGALRHIVTESAGARTPQPKLDEGDGLVYTAYRLSRSKDQLAKLAADGKLPQAVQSSTQRYRFSITLKQDSQRDPLANSSHSPIMDARLLFKRAGDLVLELWTMADFLGKASGYYKALFASGAAETVSLRRSKRQRGPNVTSEEKPLAGAADPDPSVDWEDSDDETDAFLVERDWMSCTTTKQDTAELDYQQIEFAPIRSSHALSSDELVTKRKASLATSLGEHPTLPPPVSPKSVYRLAHLLEREELQKMALDSFASGLTISGAAAELFSPVSLAYEKPRKVVVDFVVKNWNEVKATEAWQAARAKVTSRPTEGAAQVMFDVFAAIENP
ncbi:hypothetical protein B0A53_04889 [Rhodotorula sp. CCFEE 5036]|nr:hypothetical protein B0A53_04889 [Rhodotorula sp. CCFEE 5036]